ncbi:MAG: sulfite exporter TauE/SafE family protein [Ornithinibacter sp.]
MLLLALPLGVVIGLSLGALGGGGSVLTVPALVYLLGQDPRGAITSSLLIVGVTSLIGLIPHARAGRVRFGQGLVFGLLGTIGSFAGSRLSVKVSPSGLLATFAILMLMVAVLMLRSTPRASDDTSDEDPDGTESGFVVDQGRVTPSRSRALFHNRRRLVTLVATATAVGLLTGFFGVGGGFALVPALVLVLDFPMAVAVGTSLLVIAVNSATALAARAHQATELDWSLIATFTAAAVVGSLLGSRAVARVPPARLKQTFAILLVVVAVYTGAQSITTLIKH